MSSEVAIAGSGLVGLNRLPGRKIVSNLIHIHKEVELGGYDDIKDLVRRALDENHKLLLDHDIIWERIYRKSSLGRIQDMSRRMLMTFMMSYPCFI